jgi:hypothetical protein
MAPVVRERQRGRLDGDLPPREDEHVIFRGQFVAVYRARDVPSQIQRAAVGDVAKVVPMVQFDELLAATPAGAPHLLEELGHGQWLRERIREAEFASFEFLLVCGEDMLF